ncbi:MAG: NAD-dependent malic enzyme [Planctomycetes bacterium]|nr:NAD-dependent malic enzyme [Planctomycetota bacterium]
MPEQNQKSTQNSASYSISLRLQLSREPGTLARVATAIGNAGGDIGEISIVSQNRDEIVRDIIVIGSSLDHEKELAKAVEGLEGVTLLEVKDRTFASHLGGKIGTQLRQPVNSAADLAIAYTPGVGRVCMAIHDNVELSFDLTIRKNTVAIVSDGTAVLGLGDIGPEAGMPVMEGKAMLFKKFGDVDAFPICLATKDTEEIIETVKRLAPTFGGINLEDISAPRCFEIEDRLKKELDIPVFHDDQHGTAIVSTAALLNALKLVNKKIEDLKMVVCGVGAAGTACTKMIMDAGVKNVIGCDRKGAIHTGRDDLNEAKRWFAENTNHEKISGSLADIIEGADLFLGVSAPGMLTVGDLKRMAPDPIIFAMANPVPEIMPEVAAPHVAVMATGRSDYPNQINNVLAFPGIFRGAFDCRATAITENMKFAAAKAIADLVENPTPENIIPSPFDPKVAPAVAKAVREAAIADGVARTGDLSIPFAEMDR